MFGKYGMTAIAAILGLCILAVASDIGKEEQTAVIVANEEWGSISNCACANGKCTLGGTAVDIAASALEKSGYRVEKKCISYNWQNVLDACLKNRNYLIAGAFFNTERSRLFKYSAKTGLYDIFIACTLKDSGIVIDSMDDMASLVIGLTEGDSYGEERDNQFKKWSVKKYPQAEGCLDALANNEIQCYFGSEETIRAAIERYNKRNNATVFNMTRELGREPVYMMTASNSSIDMDELDSTA